MSATRSSRARVARYDLADALEHASDFSDRELRLEDFDVSQPEQIAIASIPDDLSSWAEWRPGELLNDFDDEGRFAELERFRGRAFAERASRWTPSTMPPIVLVETSDYEGVGDGRGRVSYAIGMGWPTVPAVRMVERKRTTYEANTREVVTAVCEQAKEDARQRLLAFGIDDHFSVKVKRLKNSKWLGLYRSMSQFRSRPIFWISDQIDESASAEGLAHILDRIVLDTLLHEYGHVIWEFALVRDAGLLQMIRDVEDDQEEFAETFAVAVRNGAASPGYRSIAAAYQRALLGDQHA